MTFFDKHKEKVFEPNGHLRLVQPYRYDVGNLGLCDVASCLNSASGVFADDDRKAFLMCSTHAADAHTEGISDTLALAGKG